jgi:hypothetical protein
MIIEAVDKVIGTTTMNPEIIMQLRKNTSEMCDIKYEMLNLQVLIDGVKGLDLSTQEEKLKEFYTKL